MAHPPSSKGLQYQERQNGFRLACFDAFPLFFQLLGNRPTAAPLAGPPGFGPSQ
jgi:hypothetical protein